MPRRAVAVVVAKEEREGGKFQWNLGADILKISEDWCMKGRMTGCLLLTITSVKWVLQMPMHSLLFPSLPSYCLCGTTLSCVGHDVFSSVTLLIRLRGVGPGQCRFWWVRKPAQ